MYTKLLLINLNNIIFNKICFIKNKVFFNKIVKFLFFKKKKIKIFIKYLFFFKKKINLKLSNYRKKKIKNFFFNNKQRYNTKFFKKPTNIIKKNSFFSIFLIKRYFKLIYIMYYLTFPYFFFLKKFIKTFYKNFFLKNIFNRKINNL